MSIKEYLEQARKLSTRIDAKLERIMRLRELAEKRVVAYGEYIRGSKSDRYEVVAHIVDQERILDEEIAKLLRLQSEIQAAIQNVQDEEQQTILEMRYLGNMTWGDISEKMNLDIRWLYRLHERALTKVKMDAS